MTDPGPRMTTARDRPPEEAAEDTSFARGLRLLLTVADRGEVRADELGVAARDAALDRLPLPADARRVRLRRSARRAVPARSEAAHRHRRQRQQRAAHPACRRRAADARRGDRRDGDRRPADRAVVRLPPPGRDATSRSASTLQPGDDVAALRRRARPGPARVRPARGPRRGPRAGPASAITDAHADRGRAARRPRRDRHDRDGRRARAS